MPARRIVGSFAASAIVAADPRFLSFAGTIAATAADRRPGGFFSFFTRSISGVVATPSFTAALSASMRTASGASPSSLSSTPASAVLAASLPRGGTGRHRPVTRSRPDGFSHADSMRIASSRVGVGTSDLAANAASALAVSVVPKR